MEQTKLDTYLEILDEHNISKPSLFEFMLYDKIADLKFFGDMAISSATGIWNEVDEKIINGTTEERAEVGGEVFFNAILAAFTAEYLSKKKNTNTSADDLADDIKHLENLKPDVVDEAVEGGADNVAYHSVGGDNSAKKIQSVLDGIDISYTSPESRFGQGFYVAKDGDTTVAELAYHGTDVKYSIRYDMNLEGQKILDLTDPIIANEWGFLRGESSLLECQNIAETALNEGYNVIKVYSYRDAGINYVIYDNFDKILQPQIVIPIGD